MPTQTECLCNHDLSQIDQISHGITGTMIGGQPEAGMMREKLIVLNENQRMIVGMKIAEALAERKVHEPSQEHIVQAQLKMYIPESIPGKTDLRSMAIRGADQGTSAMSRGQEEVAVEEHDFSCVIRIPFCDCKQFMDFYSRRTLSL